MVLPAAADPTGSRFTLVTSSNDSAPIIVATILSLIFSTLTFSVRLFVVKWKRHSLDDAVLGAGHLLAIGHWAAMLIAIQNNLGYSLEAIDPDSRVPMASALFASRILFLLVLCFCRLSLLLIIRSLFSWESRTKCRVIDATIVLVVLWGIVASLALSISCSPEYIFDDQNGMCSQHILRLRIIMIVEMITCFTIFIYPGIFLCSFDMALKKKMLVICAFSFTLPCLFLSAFYLTTTTNFLAHPKSGLTIISPLIFQELLIGCSLMSATIPCLKSFMEGFTTGGVGYVTDDPTIKWQSQSGYEMKWLRRTSRKQSNEAGVSGKTEERKIFAVIEEDCTGSTSPEHSTGATSREDSTGISQEDYTSHTRPSREHSVEEG